MLLSVRTGDLVGSYRIVRLLGQGGMGAVFEAEHLQIGRKAAAKFLCLDVRKHPTLYQRFVNEARACNQINHSGVVSVFEFGLLADGTPWMLMEYLEGHTFSQYLRAAHKTNGRPLGTEGLWAIYELASILSVAHEKGIVHRDLKPSNVMIVPDPEHGERVKLLDFGIAKFIHDSLDSVEAAAQFTATGAMLGTPAYMAPEQCKDSANVDGKADVYALGVIAYELFVGRPPFEDPMPLVLMAQKIGDEAPALLLRAPEAPNEVADLVMSMLAREQKDRPAMPEVRARLAAYLHVPASRRSGFVPQVTPLPAEPEGAAAGDSLGSTQSGPVPDPVPAPTADPPRATMGLTPPEQSAGQVSRPPADSPVSLGQRPTQPSQKRSIPKWLWATTGVSLCATLAIGLWTTQGHRAPRSVPPAQPLPKVAQAAIPAPAVPVSALALVPPPTPAAAHPAAPAPQAQPPTAAPVEAGPIQPARATSRVRCQAVSPTTACIPGGPGARLSAAQRDALVNALRDADVKLCPGERLRIRVSPSRATVLSAPSSVSKDAREVLIPALLGRISKTPFDAEVEIRCAR
ncbi:MAG: protein kinase [Polyangia bacterium]